MSWNAALADLHAVTFTADVIGATAAVYAPSAGPPIVLTAILDRDVQETPGSEYNIQETRHEISIQRSDVDQPKTGDSIVIGAETFRVADVLQDDGFVVRLRVRKVN